jgi:biopolymer transport protein TolR
MAFSGGSPSSPQMNVTPLIDVLLVLIIVFMVVVAEQRPTGLNAEIPQPAQPTANNIPRPQRTIVIQVKHAKSSDEHSGVNNAANNGANIEVKINDEVVAWDHLRQRLADIFAIRVERIAFIEADDDIDFQDVADVIAIARVAGVDRVGLLTEDGKHGARTG